MIDNSNDETLGGRVKRDQCRDEKLNQACLLVALVD